MRKRLFSLLLAVTLAIGLLPVEALAADGTEGVPPPVTAVIADQAQWENFVATVNADNTYQVTLTADVTAATPIPTFKGTFDGGGHQVTFTTAAPPVVQTAAQTTAQTAVQTAAQATAQTAVQTAAQATAQTAVQTAAQATAQTAAQTAAQSTDASQPAAQDAGQPAANYLFTSIAAGSTIKNLTVVNAGISSTGLGVTIENCVCAGIMPVGATVIPPAVPSTGTEPGASAPAAGTQDSASTSTPGTESSAPATGTDSSASTPTTGTNSSASTPAAGTEDATTPDSSDATDNTDANESTGSAGSSSGDNSANSSNPLSPAMFMFEGVTSNDGAACDAGDSVNVVVVSMDGNAVTIYRSDSGAEVGSAILDKNRARVEIKTGAGTPLTGGSYTLTAKVDGNAVPGSLKLTVKGSSTVNETSQPSATVTTPGAAVSTPNATVTTPGATVSNSSATVSTPSTTISKPGVTVSTPNTTVSTPSAGNDALSSIITSVESANSTLNSIANTGANTGNALDAASTEDPADDGTTVSTGSDGIAGTVALATSLGTDNRCPYGTEIELTASVTNGGAAVTGGTVTAYCGDVELGSSSAFSGGSAAIRVNTENTALLPAAGGSQERTLDVYYAASGSGRGEKIGSVKLLVVLEGTGVEAVVLRSKGLVIVSPPDGYTICKDIYSSSYTASESDWKASLSYMDSSSATATYYLRNEHGIVLTRKETAITEYTDTDEGIATVETSGTTTDPDDTDENNKGDDDDKKEEETPSGSGSGSTLIDISSGDRLYVFDELVYNGKPQKPIIRDKALGIKLIEDDHYVLSNSYTGSFSKIDDYRTYVNPSGDYTKRVDVVGNAEGDSLPHYMGVASAVTYVLKPASLTVSIGDNSSVTKTYDSSATVNVNTADVSVKFELTGVYSSRGVLDDVSVVASSYTFDNANVGEDKIVTASGLSLTGKDAYNYTLEETTVSAAIGVIEKRELTVESVTVADKVYDGTTEATIEEVLFEGGQTLNSTAYIATGTFTSSEVGEHDVSVTVTTADDSNLEITNPNFGSVKATITPATPTNIPWPKTLEGLEAGKTLEYYDSELLLAPEATGVETESGNEIVYGEFKWGVEKPGETILDVSDKEYEVIFQPVGASAQNYLAVTKKIPVSVVPANVTIDALPGNVTIEYGQKLKDIVLEGGTVTADDGTELEGTWAFDLVPDDDEPTKVGIDYAYFVSFTPNDPNYAKTSSNPNQVHVIVEKATPSITVTVGNSQSAAIQAGATYSVNAKIANPNDATLNDLPAVTLTYRIDPPDGTGNVVTVTNNQIEIPQETEEGSTLVVIASTSDDVNYKAASKTLEIKLTHRPVLTINTERRDAVFDGKGHDGLSTITFTDPDDKAVSLNRGTSGYTITWEDAGGNALDAAPVNAGTYYATVHVDTSKYFAESAPIEFAITKRPLEWAVTLTAAKREETTNEAPVSGKPALTGYVSGEQDKYKFDTEKFTLVTLGFADKTAIGEYNDVVAIPVLTDENAKVDETNPWASVLGTELANYSWPQTTNEAGKTVIASPSVIATVMRGVPGHEELCLNFAGLSSKVPDSLTMYLDIEAVKSALRKGLSSGMRNKNMRYYDLQLMIIHEDGTMELATEENFPSGGIEVVLPYPTGTDSTFTFEVVHMFTTGDLSVLGTCETFKEGSTTKPLTKDADGLHFTVTALSPVLVSWSSSARDSVAADGTTAGEIGSTPSGSRPSTSVSAEEDEYRIRLTSSTGGSISVDSRYAEPDETIEITVTAKNGYALDKLVVTDENDRTVRISQQGDKYVFTMPDSRVDVEATFMSTSTAAALPSNMANVTIGATCVYGTACPSLRYPDLNTSMWYHSSTDFVIHNNLMTGLPDGRFAPYTTLSRAMIVYILYTHAGKPTGNGSAGFTDVDRGAWYEEAVNWGVSLGIVQGVGNNRFAPNAAVTREEIAQMLYNYAVRRGINITATQAQVTYTDSTRIGAWALPAVTAMQRAGVITGKSNNMFEPKTTATRVETAQMLMNLLG